MIHGIGAIIDRLVEARKALGLSQDTLAKRLGAISSMSLETKRERGDSTSLSLLMCA